MKKRYEVRFGCYRMLVGTLEKAKQIKTVQEAKQVNAELEIWKSDLRTFPLADGNLCHSVTIVDRETNQEVEV